MLHWPPMCEGRTTAKVYLLLALLAVGMVGCHNAGQQADGDAGSGDTDTGSAPVGDTENCALGTYEGSVSVKTPAELEALIGYTSIDGTLGIDCYNCADLDALICLESVSGNLAIGHWNEEDCLDYSRSWPRWRWCQPATAAARRAVGIQIPEQTRILTRILMWIRILMQIPIPTRTTIRTPMPIRMWTPTRARTER